MPRRAPVSRWRERRMAQAHTGVQPAGQVHRASPSGLSPRPERGREVGEQKALFEEQPVQRGGGAGEAWSVQRDRRAYCRGAWGTDSSRGGKGGAASCRTPWRGGASPEGSPDPRARRGSSQRGGEERRRGRREAGPAPPAGPPGLRGPWPRWAQRPPAPPGRTSKARSSSSAGSPPLTVLRAGGAGTESGGSSRRPPCASPRLQRPES